MTEMSEAAMRVRRRWSSRWKSFLARLQIFGTDLALAKYCEKEWPSERMEQVLASIVLNRRFN